MKKNKRFPITSATLVNSLLLCSLTPALNVFAKETNIENQTTQVVGTFEATVLDVRVPASTTFIYNPNTEAMIAQNLDINNQTNAPVYIKLNEINVSNDSEWKPSLVSPKTYTDEQWKNLTQKQTLEKLSLGVNPLEDENWLKPLENTEIWYPDDKDIKVGVIKNHGLIHIKPTMKSGNSLSSGKILTTDYVFEFGLEDGMVIPPELDDVKDSGKNIIIVDPDNIEGVEDKETNANDTFTKAIALAEPGDGIYLRNGLYNIQSNDVFWSAPNKKYSNMVLRKSLTIIGDSPETTTLVIDDTNSAFRSDGANFAITFNAPNITLKNITIKVKQENIQSLSAIFNIWGNWDGSSARNVTIENVRVEVDSPVPYLFYMNDYDLNVKNVKVKGNGKISKMFYWNYGSAHFYDSKFDMPMSSAYGSGNVTQKNTEFNLPSSSF